MAVSWMYTSNPARGRGWLLCTLPTFPQSQNLCVCVCVCVCVCCTITEGDPYVAVVQSAYSTQHLSGAVHMLVFAFIHGVRPSVVWRAQKTSDNARPCPMKNRVLTTAVLPSSTYIPCGHGARGEGGIGDLGLHRLVVSEVSVVASASVLGLHTAAGVVCWHLPGLALSFCPDLCAGY